MDLKPIATAAKALSHPLVKLLEVVQNGVGALGAPLVTILNAHGDGRAKLVREGYEHRLRVLQARNMRELEASVAKLTPLLPAPTGELEVEVVFDAADESEGIATRIMESHQTAKRRANLMTIAAEAADSMPKEVGDERVDADWTARFFTYAQDVSSEDLQKLWGKILAGEVARPGEISLRTLDVLRNLTQAEALVVRRLVERVTRSAWYLPYGALALSGGEERILQDAGILASAGGALQWTIDPAEQALPVRPFHEPPGFATLEYLGGQKLNIRTAHSINMVAVWTIRPSAIPILNACKAPTSVEYLKSVVEALNSEKEIEAELVESSRMSSASERA